MPTARVAPAASIIGGKLYVIGGFTDSAGAYSVVEVHDPATNSWTTKSPMPTPRGRLATGVINDILYAVGGYAGEFSVEAYDPSTNSWTTKASLSAPRLAPAAGVINGKLYIVGGTYSPDSTKTLEEYDPSINTWMLKAPMPTPRFNLTAGVINGKLYAVGGVNSVTGGTGLGVVEVYDPTSNTWETKAPMPTPRAGMAAGVINGQLYVAGGFSAGSSNGAALEVYDPIANSWSSLPVMPTRRGDLAAAVVNDKLYTVGGTILPGQPPHATVEEYTPSSVVSVDDNSPRQQPDVFMLYQNYPNPFNPSTHIPFSLHRKSSVRVQIYNTLGQKVVTLIDEQHDAGYHIVEWNGRNAFGNEMSSGVYLCRLEATDVDGFETLASLRRMLFIK